MIDLNPLPFGNYYLLERLAVGGMAEVYLAKSFGVAGFERLVALKRILPTIAEDDEFIAMFIDEAKIAGQLGHANIAQIFDLGKINNSYFIAMEYISGHDLRALWDRAPQEGGLSLELCAYVVKKLCEGLDYAHRRRDNRGRPLGIIHRDVSPQNVLLSYDGDIKVIDFGIAKAANRMVRTQTGILKGKFAYMAPEQAKGEPTDHRADIFAIGVILYELVTGQRAFKADSDFQLLEKVRRVDITPPRKIRSEVPKALEKIIYKAMGREAKDRYAWASGLAADLDRFMSEHDLRYNKEELGAYVRRMFKEEHSEEARRLKVYNSYRPEDVNDDMLIAVPDTNTSANQETVVKSDPSLDMPATDAGADGLHLDATQESGELSADDFAAGYTLPIDEMPASVRRAVTGDESDEDEPTDAERPRPQRRTGGEKLPWQSEGGVAAPRPSETMVNIDRPGFSDEGGDARDATMLDNGPVDEEEPSVGLPNLSTERRSGVRDDARGASLQSVLGERPVGAAGNGAHVPARPRVETETFDDRRLRPARGIEPSRVAGIAAAAVAIGAVLGGLIGWLIGGGMGDHPNTIIVVQPRATSVSFGDAVLCETTPCAVRLPLGSHDLVFQAANQPPVTRSVDVGADTAFIDMELASPIAGLRVITNPPGAKVWLDGKALKGKTPLSLPELRIGQQIKLRVEAPSADYDVVEDLVEIDGRGLPLQFDLPAKKTEWVVDVEPADGVLFLTGEKPRQKRVRAEVARGENQVLVARRPGCEEKTLLLDGNGKKSVQKRIELSCAVFDARLSVFGLRGTQVSVDGIDLANQTPVREMPIPSGEHLILAKRRGKQSPYLVQVVPGQTATVNTKVK